MPATLEPKSTNASIALRHRPRLARRFVVSGLRLLVVLALGALAGGGWYLAEKGFGRSWRKLVVEELRKHGVEASVRRLTLDPFRGLVAQDVRIFDYKHRENTIAQISRLSLDVNYAALLQRQPFLNAIDVRDAEVTVPLPAGADPRSPRAEIRRLHAHVYFPPEQIYVSQADGVLCGIRVSATGQLIKRNDYEPSPPMSEEDWQERLLLVQRLVSELNKFRFETQPQLQLKFTGDIAQLEDARLTATLRAERFTRGAYGWRRFNLAAEFAERTLTLTQCEWQDDFGAMKANALWRLSDGRLELQAHSSLNVAPLLDAFGLGALVGDVRFLAPPQVEISGQGNLAAETPRWQVTGRAAFDRFAYKTIPFSSGTAEFSTDGERTMLHDVHLQHQTGELVAQVLEAPDDFRLDFANSIDLNALRSLTPQSLREFVGQWDLPRVSRAQFTIRGTSREPATWKGDGRVQLGAGRFRSVAFSNAAADVHFGDGAVRYDNFRVAREEGVATGSFVYDFKHEETRVTDLRSTLRPAEAIYWIDPELLRVVTPYKFARPPTVTANGVYQFHGGKNTRLEIAVDSPSPMQYVFLGKPLSFDHLTAGLLLTDDRLQITRLDGAIFSGQLHGGADISLAHHDERYHAALQLEQVDFARLAALYFNYKGAEGLISGRYEWNGVGANARAMAGKGDVQVRNGDVFAIPLFGPLSDMLNSIIPGLGYRVARKASMSFDMSDGVIRTSDFHVDAGTFGMLGRGQAHFLDDKIDFDLRIDASGPGAVLTPIYKLLEYKADGSLSHPRWKAKNF